MAGQVAYNKSTGEKRYNIAKGHNFSVYIGQTKIPFSKISGIATAVSVAVTKEGGNNSTSHESQKAPEANTLILERAVHMDNLKSNFLKIGTTIKKELQIYFLDDSGKWYMLYAYTGCVVTNVELSGLDATNSAIYMEKIHIKYTKVYIDYCDRK